ncbi:MAG TPA: response regulator [Patescibacteria group bacterium]|nr:response regulator [Patescibacteria group bacterium]
MDPMNPSSQPPQQPPSQGVPPSQPPATPPSASGSGQKGKILLVEDDLFLRDIYNEILQREGFTVLTADEGTTGLKLGKDNPDANLMLLDIMLPNMHGIDLLKQLKSDPQSASLPVVMLTNLTEEHVIQEAMSAGAAGYLVKVKYTPPQVVDKVKEFISFHQTHMPA